MSTVRETSGRLAVALVVIVVGLAYGASARGAASPGFSEQAFWRLMAQTRHQSGNDTGSQTSLLVERLGKMPPRSILAFAQVLKRLDKRIYTWDVWGAATVIQPDCPADCFRDFRRYVMWLGRGAYEKAVANPDSLASVVEDADNGDWENADNPAPDAYSSATGGHYPGDQRDLAGAPRGRPFNKKDRAALRKRFPRLAARFG